MNRGLVSMTAMSGLATVNDEWMSSAISGRSYSDACTQFNHRIVGNGILSVWIHVKSLN
mgnify:CR=1 FL=1